MALGTPTFLSTNPAPSAERPTCLRNLRRAPRSCRRCLPSSSIGTVGETLLQPLDAHDAIGIGQSDGDTTLIRAEPTVSATAETTVRPANPHHLPHSTGCADRLTRQC